MPPIRRLIARRSDLSTFLVHLTRDYGGVDALENLKAILRSGKLEARSPFGAAFREVRKKLPDPDTHLDSQRCVCFTEAPLEHVHLLLEPVTDLARECQFQPYGIALTKRLGRVAGINPVWYTDITPGHDWLMKSVNELIAEAVDAIAAGSGKTLGELPIGLLAPFIEQMGTGDNYRKEFWWEREWRHRLDFMLPYRLIVIAPEEDHEGFERIAEAEGWGRRFVLVDAQWGLEEIIGRLAGFRAEALGPF